MARRSVAKIVDGNPAVDGAGVHLTRVLGHRTIKDFDPFLLLDAFDSTNPADYIKGFPLHPHRGIETVTYLAQGRIEHQDSLGNKGVITDGSCQWMTAGHSILHQEMPKPSPRMLGLQLWVNLPAAQKMVPPKYRDVAAKNLPRVVEEGAEVFILAGAYKGHQGAVLPDYVAVTFLDVLLAPGQSWSVPVSPEDTAFAYVFEGECTFDDLSGPAPHKHAVLLTGGDEVQVTASDQGGRFVYISGKPLREPVAWGGPIVMNTEEEIQQAFLELENGTFVRP